MRAARPESVATVDKDALRGTGTVSVAPCAAAASSAVPFTALDAAAAAPSAAAASASASASVAPFAASPAAAAVPSRPAAPPVDELAAVKQRIIDVESDIGRVEKLLADAIVKRDGFEDDEKKWERYNGDVQRLSKKEEQLRELLIKEKEQLRDELKRKELASVQPSSTTATVLDLASLRQALAEDRQTLAQELTQELAARFSAPILSSESVLSPAHLAKKVSEQLDAQKLSETFADRVDGHAVLTDAQQADVSSAAAVSEELMVARVTAALWPWLRSAPPASGEPSDYRCLVNSETRTWLEVDPRHTEFDKKPDLWLGPYYAVQTKAAPDSAGALALHATAVRKELSLADVRVRYVFGVPADRAWHDSVFPMAAKKSLSGEAFGEAIIDLKLLSACAPDGCTRGMVFDAEQFYLLRCHQGAIISRMIARWRQPGSGELLRDFFSVYSPWERAVHHFCHRLQLLPVRHLGRGGMGRVLEVQRGGGPSGGTAPAALKVVLQSNVDTLTHEFTRLRALLKDAVPALREVLPDSVESFESQPSSCAADGPCAAAFLLTPVGRPLQRDEVLRSRPNFTAVFGALRRLHQHGVCHGDPRLPNLLQRVRRAEPREASNLGLHSFYSTTSSASHAAAPASASAATSVSFSSGPAEGASHGSYFWVDFVRPDVAALRQLEHAFAFPAANAASTTRFLGDLQMFFGFLLNRKLDTPLALQQAAGGLTCTQYEASLSPEQDAAFAALAAAIHAQLVMPAAADAPHA